MTAGKRRAALDLRSAEGTAILAPLVAQSDVLVCGLRPDALGLVGFDDDRLRSLNASLVIARINAYGWQGPWRDRRGFDSLVQMSTGIAARGQRIAGSPEPLELPCAALDYATGYLAAASVCRAVTALIERGEGLETRLALGQTATLLSTLPASADWAAQPTPPLEAHASEAVATAWGPARAVPVPGAIGGHPPATQRPAGPQGRGSAVVRLTDGKTALLGLRRQAGDQGVVLGDLTETRGPTRRTETVEELRVRAVEVAPLLGHVVLIEDRLDGAHRLARAAVDALVGLDVEHPLALVDAVDRTLVHAGTVLHVHAGLGDDVRHSNSLVMMGAGESAAGQPTVQWSLPSMRSWRSSALRAVS